jgi:TfoX/Sxy family transcriptional regulator of competence genes
MKWKKSSAELVKVFEEVVPGPPATARQMFGFPAAFVNGHMFMGLHQNDMILRLEQDSRTEICNAKGARIFEPMPGRPMREYVVVPPAILGDRDQLKLWVGKALKYAAALPVKVKKGAPKKRRAQG